MHRRVGLLLMLALVFMTVGTSEAICRKYRDVVQTRQGAAIAGVSVRVNNGGTTTLATIYSEKTCTTVLANPFNTRGDGTYEFYAMAGPYDLTYTRAPYTFLGIQDVLLPDLGAQGPAGTSGVWTRTATQTLNPGTQIDCAVAATDAVVPVVGNAGPVILTSSPQIRTNNVAAGRPCVVQGTSATSTVTLHNGDGLTLQASRRLGLGDQLFLVYDGATWIEVAYIDFTLGSLGLMAPQSVTCPDSGDANPGTLTVIPTSRVINVTNSDVHGCTVTIGETGIVAATPMTMIIISNAGGTVNFADTPGVSETAGPFNAAITDTISFVYTNGAWYEIGRSNN